MRRSSRAVSAFCRTPGQQQPFVLGGLGQGAVIGHVLIIIPCGVVVRAALIARLQAARRGVTAALAPAPARAASLDGLALSAWDRISSVAFDLAASTSASWPRFALDSLFHVDERAKLVDAHVSKLVCRYARSQRTFRASGPTRFFLAWTISGGALIRSSILTLFTSSASRIVSGSARGTIL